MRPAVPPILTAQEASVAVPHFNFGDFSLLSAILDSGEDLKSPVYLGILPGEVKTFGSRLFPALNLLAERCSVPAVVHLDHSTSFEDVREGIALGCTSVMFDGSALPFEENIRVTSKVVEYASEHGVWVESEIGVIGTGDTTDESSGTLRLTEVAEAVEFAEKTGTHSLAVSIGTHHGTYPPGVSGDLDLNRLSEIASKVSVPLVLHGASATPDRQVREAVARGMSKVNFSRDLKVAFYTSVRETLSDLVEREPFRVNQVGMDAAREVVRNKINLCGSAGMGTGQAATR